MRSIGVSRPLKGAFVSLLAGIILCTALAHSVGAKAYIARIESNFRLEEFKRSGDGYRVTISNDSVHAFSDFLVVILGTDISGVTVFRRDFPVEFMEGRSERTFLVPGYDDRVFDVKLRVLAPLHEAYLR